MGIGEEGQSSNQSHAPPTNLPIHPYMHLQQTWQSRQLHQFNLGGQEKESNLYLLSQLYYCSLCHYRVCYVYVLYILKSRIEFKLDNDKDHLNKNLNSSLSCNKYIKYIMYASIVVGLAFYLKEDTVFNFYHNIIISTMVGIVLNNFQSGGL